MELPYCGFWINHSTTCDRVSTSVSSFSSYPFMFSAIVLFSETLIIIFLYRAFQEYEGAMSALTINRNFLSDSYGDFLFNNDEYLWNPMTTYYRKRLL